MSYIAAMLLMYEDEYCSFMIFYNMITKPFIIPFFLFNESYISKILQLFEKCLSQQLSKLGEWLQKEEITPQTYAIEWFLTFYAKTLNPDIASRIWDVYLFEGMVALFKAGLTIFALIEHLLINKEMSQIIRIIKNIHQLIWDENEFITVMKSMKISQQIEKELEDAIEQQQLENLE